MIAHTIHPFLWGSHLGVQYVRSVIEIKKNLILHSKHLVIDNT